MRESARSFLLTPSIWQELQLRRVLTPSPCRIVQRGALVRVAFILRRKGRSSAAAVHDRQLRGNTPDAIHSGDARRGEIFTPASVHRRSIERPWKLSRLRGRNRIRSSEEYRDVT